MNHETRQALIDAGLIIPGSKPDADLTLVKLPPDRVVLRLDDAGRAAAAKTIARDTGHDGARLRMGHHSSLFRDWEREQSRNRRAA